MIYNYLFEFQNGSTILVPAADKMKAIKIISREYYTLFESENFKVTRIELALDKDGNIIRSR